MRFETQNDIIPLRQLSVGMVVPTLSKRPEQLKRCLDSLKAADIDLTVIVAPQSSLSELKQRFSSASIVFVSESQSSSGAASAINQGLARLLQEDIEIVGWLGDDDFVNSAEFKCAASEFAAQESYSACVGKCRIISEKGTPILTLAPSRFDVFALEFKSNKLPQPGSMFRAEAVRKTGLLDETLKFAFDQDLFHRLKQMGGILTTKYEVASYTWGTGTLSFENARASRLESFRTRRRYARGLAAILNIAHFNASSLALKFLAPRLR